MKGTTISLVICLVLLSLLYAEVVRAAPRTPFSKERSKIYSKYFEYSEKDKQIFYKYLAEFNRERDPAANVEVNVNWQDVVTTSTTTATLQVGIAIHSIIRFGK